ncbi:ribbon-helix-helix domain-containing protein [Ectobacillus funiculus]|uniref:hypothetical protein n=1 Tax=Ectobacillus funiculus TaxID=137993 RepID=UPI00397BBD68
MKQFINMRYPVKLLKRIDNFKEENDFTTRTQAIIYLIQFSLKKLEKPSLK